MPIAGCGDGPEHKGGRGKGGWCGFGWVLTGHDNDNPSGVLGVNGAQLRRKNGSLLSMSDGGKKESMKAGKCFDDVLDWLLIERVASTGGNDSYLVDYRKMDDY
jgi:hypothetical protein